MLPSPPSLGLETALASQHVLRITGALQANSGGGWSGQTQGIFYWLAEKNNLHFIKAWHVAQEVSYLELQFGTLMITQGNSNANTFLDSQVIAQGCTN